MSRYIVARVDDIPIGERLIVTVAGRDIGIFNVDGRFYALRNRCPHQGAQLCRGRINGYLDSDRPGEYVHDSKRHLVRCPWHGWEFDISTGQSWVAPDAVRVRSYPVSIVQNHGDEEWVEGPYVAESYEVTVDGEHIAVDVESA